MQNFAISTEQCFFKVVVTFESMDDIFYCSN